MTYKFQFRWIGSSGPLNVSVYRVLDGWAERYVGQLDFATPDEAAAFQMLISQAGGAV